MLCPICGNDCNELYESNRYNDSCFDCFEYGNQEDALEEMYSEMEHEHIENEEVE